MDEEVKFILDSTKESMEASIPNDLLNHSCAATALKSQVVLTQEDRSAVGSQNALGT